MSEFSLAALMFLRVLSDRGSVFLGRVMSNVCDMLGVDRVSTSPYRPQSNGVEERFHGTLKPMLAKAVESGVDWASDGIVCHSPGA